MEVLIVFLITFSVLARCSSQPSNDTNSTGEYQRKNKLARNKKKTNKQTIEDSKHWNGRSTLIYFQPFSLAPKITETIQLNGDITA